MSHTETRLRASARRPAATPFPTPMSASKGRSAPFSPSMISSRAGSPSRPLALSFTPKPDMYSMASPRAAAMAAPMTAPRPSFMDQSAVEAPGTGAPSVVESNLRHLIREKEKELHSISAYKTHSVTSGDNQSLQSLKLDHEYNLKLLSQRTRELEEVESRLKDMELTVEDSQRDVTQSKESIERLQAKLLEAQHVGTDKQTIIDRLELQLHELTKNNHAQLEKLRWECEEKLQSQRELAEKQRRDSEADLRQKVLVNKNQASELAKLRSTYQNTIEEARTSFITSEEKLRVNLSQESRQVEELNAEVKVLKQYQQDARTTVDSYKRQIADLQNRIKAGTWATEEVQQESYQRIQQMTATNATLTTEKAELLEEYHAKVGELVAQLQAMEKEISQQRMEYENQTTQMMITINAAAEEEINLNNQLEQSQNEHKKAQEDNATLDESVETLREGLKRATSESQSIERRRQADHLAIKDVQLNLDRKTRELELRNSQLMELKGVSSTSDGEVIHLRKAVEELKKQRQEQAFELTSQNKEMETGRERHKTELNYVTEKLNTALDKLAASKSKNKEVMEAKSDELETTKADLQQRLTSTTSELAGLRVRNATLNKQVKSLQEQVSEMNETIQSLSVNQKSISNTTAAVLLGSPRSGGGGGFTPFDAGISGINTSASVAGSDTELVGMMKHQFETLQTQLDGMKKKQKHEREKKARRKQKEKEKEYRRREKEKAYAMARRQEKERHMSDVYNNVLGHGGRSSSFNNSGAAPYGHSAIPFMN